MLVLNSTKIICIGYTHCNNNIIISIDGNIGSVKSTLLTNLKEFYKNNKKNIFLKEHVDEWKTITDENSITIL